MKPHTLTLHEPVLLADVLQVLAPKSGDSYLDLTAGYGGHAAAIAGMTHGEVTLVDRDQNAVDELTKKFAEAAILHQDFLAACQKLTKENRQFDLILADLGVSSPHLNNAERGFSILADGPLDMRMDPGQELTAHQVVNTWSEAQLAEILRTYGEEPKAAQIARLVVQARPLETTTQLAAVAAKAWPGHSRVHPATRTFQAIRIAVNDELGQLAQALPLMMGLLAPGGRLAIISFHSLEDRLVKQFLKEQAGDAYDAPLQLLTKRPLVASATEVISNPRARSAKLRAAVKK